MIWLYLLDLAPFTQDWVQTHFAFKLTRQEIFGLEISFSKSEGIFLSPPRQCYGAVFRKSLKIGRAKIPESVLKAHLLSMMYAISAHTSNTLKETMEP